jgi:hypothetical protein
MSMEFGEEDEFGGIEFEDDGMVASQSQDPLNTSSGRSLFPISACHEPNEALCSVN